jgi:predicted enzyme involved in methoxymalonyl-ACP biosynthesis
VKRASLKVIFKIACSFNISLDSLVFDDSPVRLPKGYREFAELLADCNIGERKEILKNAADYKRMIRAE